MSHGGVGMNMMSGNGMSMAPSQLIQQQQMLQGQM
jgi:hypothetical protein